MLAETSLDNDMVNDMKQLCNELIRSLNKSDAIDIFLDFTEAFVDGTYVLFFKKISTCPNCIRKFKRISFWNKLITMT